MADKSSVGTLRRDVIVIGGSAGGVEALTALVAALPSGLPAAVCVVLHRPAYVRSNLAEILGRSGPLPAQVATQGMPLERGIIYLAPTDHHLLVERAPRADDSRGRKGGAMLRVTRGPKENRARPAIDPLFRSAALAFGPRVIGVVLSGALDDGTAGLWSIRDQGGLAVIQEPADAAVASMPASALAEVGADHVRPALEIGQLLAELVNVPLDAPATTRAPDAQSIEELRREVAMATVDDETHEGLERYGVPSRFACPDCSGCLWETSNGRGPIRLRCSVGHAYTAAGLAEAQVEQIEHGLWAALRALEDKAQFARTRASYATDVGLTTLAAQQQAMAEATLTQAAAVRAVLRLDTFLESQTDPSADEARADDIQSATPDIEAEQSARRAQPSPAPRPRAEPEDARA